MDKMVEIARFQYPADAYTLIALLKAEDIECYLRNEHSAQILSYMDVGGARLEVLEKDLPRAMEIMEEGGYLPFSEGEVDPIVRNTGWMSKVPVLRNYSFGAQMAIFILLILLALGLFLGLGLYLQSLNTL